MRYASERIKNDSSLFIKWIKESESLHCLDFAEFSIQTNQCFTHTGNEVEAFQIEVSQLPFRKKNL